MAPERAPIDRSDLLTNGCDLPVDVDKLFRDVPPIGSVDDLAAPGLFKADGELDEFLAFVHRDPDAKSRLIGHGTPIVLDTDVASSIIKKWLPASLARISSVGKKSPPSSRSVS